MTLATSFPPNPPAARQVALVAKPRVETRCYEMPDDYPTGGDPDFGHLGDLKRVSDDLLGQYGEFAIVARADAQGDTKLAQAADFGGPDGAFVLTTAEPLPADLMARALAAAYLVVRDEFYARYVA